MRGSKTFMDWILSEKTQDLIEEFGVKNLECLYLYQMQNKLIKIIKI